MPHFSIISFCREFLWPIKKEELSVFLPMSLLMFCVLFNFSALRSIKDSLVVPGIGAEVISFIKFWVILPFAVGFSILYARLSNSFSSEKIFYIIVTFFISILLFFVFIIYPQEEFFHLDVQIINYYSDLYPNFKWPLKVLGKWSYVLVYLIAELWSAIVISLMFWQLANSIVTTSQAKRIYPYFTVIGNFGLVFSGLIMLFSSSDIQIIKDFFNQADIDNSGSTLRILSLAISFFGILSMFLYSQIISYVQRNNIGIFNKEKTKLSVKESLIFIFQSKYLWNILLILVAYGLAINVVEGPWKNKIKELYPTTSSYIYFMGNFNIWMGISSIIFTIFGSNILRFGSWLMAALVTPVVIGITGSLFFVFVIFSSDFTDYEKLFIDPIFAAVILGAIQNIASKSTKYSLFDATKEMLYIPLDAESKIKGKAAVDVVGTKLGKSLGAFSQSFMFALFPAANFDFISPYLMIIFILIIFIWIFAVKNLNKQYLDILEGVQI